MRSSRPRLATVLLATTFATAAFAAGEPELGVVRWGRDLDAALATARATGRPVLVLFDEVPGCATCRGFGQDVLSHALLAEAMESEFVPVFVANNRAGRDAAWLARYGEPAWNNPVVRFLGADGRDVVPRRDGLYSAHEIAARMVEALRAADRTVPRWLEVALEETGLAHRRTATFATWCYWEGEARLGALPGVLAARAVETRAGEAVRVEFDESRLSHEALVRAAARLGYRRELPAGEPAHDAAGANHLRALAGSPLRSLALTPLQALRVNASIANGEDALAWLTPRQREQAQNPGARVANRESAPACRAPVRR